MTELFTELSWKFAYMHIYALIIYWVIVSGGQLSLLVIYAVSTITAERNVEITYIHMHKLKQKNIKVKVL